MKRIILCCCVVFCLLLCACDIKEKANKPITDLPVPDTTTVAEATTIETPDIEEPKNSSMKFMFASGAGGWRTLLTLRKDGSFFGEYIDSDMGNCTEDYPGGTCYICNFEGRFKGFKKTNDYTYSMSIDYINTEHEIGEVWIEDDVRYIASAPYGIDGGTEFLLYTPNAPLNEMPEEFLNWIWRTADEGTLDNYAIFNIANNCGFEQSEAYYTVEFECELLAEQYINNVMTEEWLLSPYSFNYIDITRFLDSICLYIDSVHPFANMVTMSDDSMFFQMDFHEVNETVKCLFDNGEWALTTYADERLDENGYYYRVPNGIGLYSSPFSYKNMTSDFDGEYIYVNFTLVNSNRYEYEEANYGNFTFVFNKDYKLVEIR